MRSACNWPWVNTEGSGYKSPTARCASILTENDDTDIIAMAIYYAVTLKDLAELWVKRGAENYLPVHDISDAIGT